MAGGRVSAKAGILKKRLEVGKNFDDLKTQIESLLENTCIDDESITEQPIHPNLTLEILRAIRDLEYDDRDILRILFKGETPGGRDWINVDLLLEEDERTGRLLELHQNSLFLDTEGRLGIATAGAQEGDSICFIKGGYRPVLLRSRAAGGWRIVSGNCYIYATFPDPVDLEASHLPPGLEEVDLEIW